MPKTTIIMGNKNASLEVTMVSNSFCNPCAKAHQFLEEWIEKGVDFKLNIVYTFSMADDDQQKLFFIHLMQLQKEGLNIEMALKDWYSSDYQKLAVWKDKHPVKNKAVDKLLLLEQVNWCKLNEIKGTPTFYINGNEIPNGYSLKELKYVLMNLDN
ncbi:thioredoxin domain-containing protein [Pedobacter alpinus]|uniref:Thioredoxin domain-containing protein n=1 Tax=Pedobacter alpinus TaxID=1590643 RepID=A0ABW5TPW5_9SPHI